MININGLKTFFTETIYLIRKHIIFLEPVIFIIKKLTFLLKNNFFRTLNISLIKKKKIHQELCFNQRTAFLDPIVMHRFV